MECTATVRLDSIFLLACALQNIFERVSVALSTWYREGRPSIRQDKCIVEISTDLSLGVDNHCGITGLTM